MSKKRKFIIIFLFILLIISIILLIILLYNLKDNSNSNNIVNTTTKIKDNSKKINISLFGDMLIEGPFYRSINKNHDEDKYFKRVNDKYFIKDDLSIGNLEVPISSNNKFLGDAYVFVSPPSIANIIKNQSIEVLGTANNHSYDQGIDGINSTIDYFKNNSSIKTIGTYKSKDDRNNIVNNNIIEKNGIKVGFLAYTLFTNIKIDKENRYKISYFRDPETKIISDEYKNIIKEEVNKLRSNVDVLIVLMHWGKEFTYNISNDQIEMANYLNSLGVDIIVGSHSHNMQKIDLIDKDNKTLVFYSMGNFASADADLDRTVNDNTFDNSYQIGLVTNLDIVLNNNKINFENIKSEPIINYFDSNEENYELIPFSQYNEEYEKNHYRYSFGLNKTFIKNTFEEQIDSKYR